MKKNVLKNQLKLKKFSGFTCVLKSALVILSCFSFQFSFSQAGTSSASFTYAANIPYQQMIASKDIIVEDFMNYHRHLLPMPGKNESIHLDLQWGNENMMLTYNTLLQIGLSSKLLKDAISTSPVNICFVIDHSGSMGEYGKLSRVKEALTQVIKKLHPDDFVSVVIYDSNTRVLVASQKMSENNSKIISLINEITEGSSTNLNAGMVAGYNEALKNYIPGGTNRVILLTDGLANTGETNLEKIILNSTEYNKKGIDISTIGVGSNVNFQLLQQMAKNGKGQSHFIGDNDNLQKVFVDEVESLLSNVAKDVKLVIKYDTRLNLDEFYGYAPEHTPGTLTLSLDDINNGATQILLAKFKNKEQGNGFKPMKISVKLSFHDVAANKRKTIEKEIVLTKDPSKNCIAFSKDRDILKNYAIAEMALGLKKAALEFESGKKESAIEKFLTCITSANSAYNMKNEDKDFNRVSKIIGDNYKKITGKNIEENLTEKKNNSGNETSVSSEIDNIDTFIPESFIQKKNTYAVIIGNEDYSSFQPDLLTETNADFAVNDARIFKEYCNKTLGVPLKHIRYIENATAVQMNQAFNWLKNLSKIDQGKAEIIVYFSGHGLPDDKTSEPLLIPVDVNSSSLEYGIKLSDICEKLSVNPCKQVTIFLDACFSGGSRSSGLTTSKGIKIKARTDFKYGNTVVFSSSSSDETSEVMKETKHGFFTYFLLKKIQESQGDFTLNELALYVSENVRKTVCLEGKMQTPAILAGKSLNEEWKNWKLK